MKNIFTRLSLAALIILCLFSANNVAAQNITTVAGGRCGYSGDGGAATAAALSGLDAIAVDTSGNQYIADINNNVVRLVTTSGIISTFAGNGTAGFSGDGGAATAAKLNGPSGLAVDRSGNLYISDFNNNRVRKVTPSGIISTIAGNAAAGFSGDGGAATAAKLQGPCGLELDASGNLYIADELNHRIRKVTPSGIISTIAGSGYGGFGGDGGPATSAGLWYPSHVAIDGSGNLFIVDVYNNRIRKVNATGIISTIAGNGVVGLSGDGGFATAAEMYYPNGVAVDQHGNVYIVELNNGLVRKVSPSGIISKFAGYVRGYVRDSLSALSGYNCQPPEIAVDRYGFVYFPDISRCWVRKVDSCAVPFVPAITGSSTVCVGDSITLFDSAIGGTWSSADTGIASVRGGVVRGLANGMAEILYSKSNSCGTGIVSFWVTVDPFAGSIGPTFPSAICVGSTTMLSGSRVGGVWSSGASSIATVDTSGSVTGISSGICTISYSRTGSCGTAIATFNMTVDSTPDPGTISGYAYYGSSYSGGGYLFACIPNFIYVSETVSGGYWSSDAPSIATVDYYGDVWGSSAGSATISYTVFNSCGSSSATLAVYLDSLPRISAITGPTQVCQGATITLHDSTSGGTWSTSITSVATVRTTGVVTGVSPGTSIISYSLTNFCGTAVDTMAVDVIAPPNADSITGLSTVCVGASIALRDTARGGTWSSSNSSIASVGSSGTVTGVSTGSATVSYSVTNICGTAVATHPVTVNPLPNSGIITGPSVACSGATITLTDTAHGGTWSVSSGSIATISSAGVLTGLAAGRVIVTYSVTNSCGTAIDTIMVAFVPYPYAGAITGASSLCIGATTTLTDTASGGTWSSSSTSTATISSSGIVRGVSAGTTTVSYTVTNGCGTAATTRSITVETFPSPGTITGPTAVCPGTTITLSDTASGGTWSVSSTSIATISSTGVLTGVAAGSVVVTYSVTNSCGTATDTMLVTVNPLPNAGSISGAFTACSGAAAFTLTETATGGTWSTSSTSLATVNSSGLVRAVGVGVAVISYTVTNSCGTAVATHSVTISTTPSVSSISGASSLCTGDTTVLTDITTGGTWSSATPSIATIDTSGTFRAVSAGSAIISYSLSNSCGTTSVTRTIIVRGVPTVRPISGASTLCAGGIIVLTDSSTGGVWHSNSSSVATVNSFGVVTGVGAGIDTIRYTISNSCGSASAIFVLTVSATPPTAALTSLSTLCPGDTTTCTASLPGGSWTSSDAFIGTVDTAGLVRAVAAGTATISYTITNLCGSSHATQTIAVNPLPVAGSISGTDSLCPGLTTTLTNPSTGGTWFSTNASIASISSTGTVSSLTAGSVNILYIITNTCGSDTAVFPFLVRDMSACPDEVTDLQNKASSSLQLYPNPSNGELTVNLSSTFNEQVHFTITNMLGEKVTELVSPTNQDIRIQLRVPAGIYFISALTDGERLVRKIVVE